MPGGNYVLSYGFCLEFVLCCFIGMNRWQWEQSRRWGQSNSCFSA